MAMMSDGHNRFFIKKICIALMMLAVCMVFMRWQSVQADEPEERPIVDVILLLDVSGSMRYTDPRRAAMQAAEDVIYMLTLGESRVGIVAVNYASPQHIPFSMLYDEDARSRIVSQVHAFPYWGFSDFGSALLLAARMLYNAEEPLNNPMMILIADGGIALWPSRRTVQNSWADIFTALDIIDGLDEPVPIYTVGIHNDFDFHGVDVELLTMLAAHTSAFAVFTYDANELPYIFSDIMHHHVAQIEMPEVVIEYEEEPEPEPEIEYEPEPEPEPVVEDEPEYEYEYEYEEAEYEYDYEYEYEIIDEPTESNNITLYALAILGAMTAVVTVFKFVRVVVV